MKLFNGDCLDIIKTLEPTSVDLVFLDLPYGQTNCEWDNKIDLNELWKQLKRVIKTHTPLFFTCSTKFGYELIKSNEKWFRYDLVWEKTSPTGFLCAKKMPMKKHEMIYVFYEKLPLYDISSHKHKFINEGKNDRPTNSMYGNIMKTSSNNRNEPQYDPPLPTSVIKVKVKDTDNVYGDDMNIHKYTDRVKRDAVYDPPLPTSVIKVKSTDTVYGDDVDRLKYHDRISSESIYEPPLPTSILQFKSEKGKHKTQKPLTMMNWILNYYSKENDIILDPTMGSGSMGVACKEMNREFIGIEMNEEIYKSACKRLEYDENNN